ncbi:LysE family translocator [Hyphobacterium sp.]|uniref:LysE family translocator n=1 Tax=Hyphobacterium sp. TaxID=2004662 RepID=UPI003747E596
MIDLAILPIFIAGAVALAIAPGPDMAFTMATTASSGRQAGLAALLGINIGAASWLLATVLGLSAMLAATEHALTVVRWVGGAYLVFLAVQTLRHWNEAPTARAAGSVRRAMIRGATTNLLNPKIGLFFMAFLPQFTNAELGPVWVQLMTLAAIFMAIGNTVLISVIFVAGAARAKLAQSLTLRRVLNGVAATAFGALGLRLILSRDTA